MNTDKKKNQCGSACHAIAFGDGWCPIKYFNKNRSITQKVKTFLVPMLLRGNQTREFLAYKATLFVPTQERGNEKADALIGNYASAY